MFDIVDISKNLKCIVVCRKCLKTVVSDSVTNIKVHRDCAEDWRLKVDVCIVSSDRKSVVNAEDGVNE